MTLKRILFILLCVITCGIARAELDEEQKAIRSDIMQFLRVEGYSPEIDSDGDIAVKIEGAPYYIRVYEEDKSPMFVSMWRLISYPEGVNKLVARLAVTELNRYKMVKVNPLDSSVSIQTTMYLREPEAFKYAFHKMVSQIQSAARDFPSECEAARKELRNM